MKVLIIRFSSMGDVLLTTPLIRMLKKQLSAEISFLLKSEYQELIIHNQYVDKVYAWAKTDNEELLKSLKSETFDYKIDLQNSIRSIRVRSQISGKLLSVDKNMIRKWQLNLLGVNRYTGQHIVQDYLKAVESFRLIDDGEGLNFSISEIEILNRNINNRKKITIVAGGSYTTKRIPLPLIQELIKEKTYQFIIIGGNDVGDNVANISGENVANLVGQLSIQESAKEMRDSDIVLTGDTGMMHIAAAFQLPIIVIWGSTAPEIGFYPYYGSNSDQRFISIQQDQLSCHPCSKYGRPSCPKGHLDCLRKVTSAEVLDAISTLLG